MAGNPYQLVLFTVYLSHTHAMDPAPTLHDHASLNSDIDVGLHAPTNAEKEFNAEKLDAALSDDAALIAALRSAIKLDRIPPEDTPYWGSPHCLHRFLVARGMDVKKAAEVRETALHYEPNLLGLDLTHACCWLLLPHRCSTK